MSSDPSTVPALEVQGAAVPKLGFGTWQITGEDCVEAVADALEIGYRHIDTARMYGNEREVGRALGASGVAREDLWITTKVWMDDAEPARLRRSAEGSLRDLGLDSVDLLLLHWPNHEVPLQRTIAALEELREEGRTRLIGVSNFPPAMLTRALGYGPVAADQVEYHPFLGQDELLRIAAERELMITAYSPLAHGKATSDPDLAEIGAAHGKSAGQVALRWLLDQPQVTAVPKASSHDNRVANMDIFDFELSSEERARIDSLPKDRRDADPDWGPDWED